MCVCVCVPEGLLHKLLSQKCLWMTWMTDRPMSLKSLRIMFGVSVCRGVKICWSLWKRVCVFLHVRGQSGTRGTRWICGCWARKRERRSTSTRVTYVWVYPCMCCLEKKYKTQKGFPCNVHLSVSEHPFLLCFQSQWRCLLMLLIINTRKHHIPTLVPWLFCVNSRMSGKIFVWRSK